MDITFGNAKIIKRYLKNPQSFGSLMQKKIAQRLVEIGAFPCLKDLMKSQLGRPHELHGSQKGQFSIDLPHPQRLVFRPTTPGCIENGVIILDKVTSVEIISIEDTH